MHTRKQLRAGLWAAGLVLLLLGMQAFITDGAEAQTTLPFSTNFDANSAGALTGWTGPFVVTTTDAVSASNAFGGASMADGNIALFTGQTTATDEDVTFKTIVHIGGIIGTILRSDAAGNNQYLINPGYNGTGGSGTFYYKIAGGSYTAIGSNFTCPTFGAGTVIDMRCRVLGSTLYFKIWANSGAEPVAWTATAVDASSRVTAAGVPGFRISTGGTNSAMAVDDLPLTVPSTSISIAETDAAWVKSPYNWNGGTAVCPGAYRRILYSASGTVNLTFNTVNIGSPPPVLAARFDNGPWSRFNEASSVTLSSPASRPQPRLLEIAFAAVNNSADRWTSNPPVGAVQFTGLVLDAGASVSAPPVRPKRVVVLGDSIKEGTLALSSTASDVTDNDATLAYPYLLAQALNAEVGVIAYSGQGVTRNLASSNNAPALTGSYGFYWSGAARSYSSQPDLLIIDEGQNDPASTASVQSGLISIAGGVAAKKTLIMTDLLGFNTSYEQAAAAAFGGFSAAPPTLLSSDKLDAYHPTAAAHATKLLPTVAASAYPLLYGGSGTKRRLQ